MATKKRTTCYAVDNGSISIQAEYINSCNDVSYYSIDIDIEANYDSLIECHNHPNTYSLIDNLCHIDRPNLDDSNIIKFVDDLLNCFEEKVYKSPDGNMVTSTISYTPNGKGIPYNIITRQYDASIHRYEVSKIHPNDAFNMIENIDEFKKDYESDKIALKSAFIEYIDPESGKSTDIEYELEEDYDETVID